MSPHSWLQTIQVLQQYQGLKQPLPMDANYTDPFIEDAANH